jgi:hypothetical protein
MGAEESHWIDSLASIPVPAGLRAQLASSIKVDASHEPFIAKEAENTGLLGGVAGASFGDRPHNPFSTAKWRRAPTEVEAAADVPNTPNGEGQSSQRQHHCGRHQTIILPCVGANLPSGHIGTRVSSKVARSVVTVSWTCSVVVRSSPEGRTNDEERELIDADEQARDRSPLGQLQA